MFRGDDATAMFEACLEDGNVCHFRNDAVGEPSGRQASAGIKMMDEWILVGRSSSHYARVVRIVAAELGVSYRLKPIFEFMAKESACSPGTLP
jgi:hypothetical protein